MAKAKNETPIVTSHGDYEVIQPPHKLNKAVTKVKPGTPIDDPVARAEAALADLSTEFNAWMETECERLLQARTKLKSIGVSDATRDELFRAAHDIKGEAETFGFPLAGKVGDSLCRLIEHSPDFALVPMALIDQHVDAVRAIIREAKQANADAKAAELTARLRQVTDDFLAHENRHRPEYLDGILAPSIAPDDSGM